MLFNSNIYYILSDCLTFDLWEVVINLLQEDDLEVKDVTCSMTSVLSGGSHLADVQPTLALQLMVAKMVAIHGHRNRTGCIRTLITWIKNSDAVCEVCRYITDHIVLVLMFM